MKTKIVNNILIIFTPRKFNIFRFKFKLFTLYSSLFTLLCSLFTVHYSLLYAEKKNTGIGVVLSDVPALSVKVWLENERVNIKRNIALDFAFGFKSGNYLYLHATYIVKHDYKLINKGELTGELPFYYGPGIVFKSNNIGIRNPLGLEYVFEEVPLDIFAEIVPTVFLFGNNTGIELSAGIGVRYFFK